MDQGGALDTQQTGVPMQGGPQEQSYPSVTGEPVPAQTQQAQQPTPQISQESPQPTPAYPTGTTPPPDKTRVEIESIDDDEKGGSDTLMKVIIFAVVILFLAALGIGGWYLYKKFFAKEATGDTGDVQLTWWILYEDEENLQQLADLYHEQHPNVTITIEKQIETQYKERLLGQVNDNLPSTGPDIMRIHNSWLPQFQNYLAALPSSVMSESEYSEAFYDTALLDFKSSNSSIYAIPLMYDGLGVYYNKNLLKAAGYTVPEESWDDFLTQARKLTKYYSDGSIKIAGVGMGTADNIDSSFDIVSLLMLQEGASMVNNSGKTTFATDPDMRAASAIKFYTDFATRYEVWDRTLPRDITMFTEGRLAMMFAPSWRVHDINEALSGAGATLDYDIAPVPQQPSLVEESVTWSSYWAEAVSAETSNPEVAWDFLKFVSQADQLRTFYSKCKESREFGEIYPRKDMAEELITEKYVSAYIKMAESSRSWRMVDKEKVAGEFDKFIEEISSSRSLSVEEIHTRLEDVASVVDQIIVAGS